MFVLVFFRVFCFIWLWLIFILIGFLMVVMRIWFLCVLDISFRKCMRVVDLLLLVLLLRIVVLCSMVLVWVKVFKIS